MTDAINHGRAANSARQFIRQALDLQSLLGVLDRVADDERYLAELPGRRAAGEREVQELSDRLAQARTDTETGLAKERERADAVRKDLGDREHALRQSIAALEQREAAAQKAVEELERKLATLRDNARAIAG